jgi:hypothetical protein
MSETRTDLISLRQIMSTNPPTRQWENLLLLIGEDFNTYNPSRLVSAGDVLKVFKLAHGKRIVSKFCDEIRVMATLMPAVRAKGGKSPAMAEVYAILDQIDQWIDGGDEPDFQAALLASARISNFMRSVSLLCLRPGADLGPIIKEEARDRQDDEKQLRDALAVFPLHAVPEF